jgi:hypothetical protein
MSRADVVLKQADYDLILEYAERWQPELAEFIKRTAQTVGSQKKLSHTMIPEALACALLFDFFDAEINAYSEQEVPYYGRLAELWRPLAEKDVSSDQPLRLPRLTILT